MILLRILTQELNFDTRTLLKLELNPLASLQINHLSRKEPILVILLIRLLHLLMELRDGVLLPLVYSLYWPYLLGCDRSPALVDYREGASRSMVRGACLSSMLADNTWTIPLFLTFE